MGVVKKFANIKRMARDHGALEALRGVYNGFMSGLWTPTNYFSHPSVSTSLQAAYCAHLGDKIERAEHGNQSRTTLNLKSLKLNGELVYEPWAATSPLRTINPLNQVLFLTDVCKSTVQVPFAKLAQYCETKHRQSQAAHYSAAALGVDVAKAAHNAIDLVVATATLPLRIIAGATSLLTDAVENGVSSLAKAWNAPKNAGSHANGTKNTSFFSGGFSLFGSKTAPSPAAGTIAPVSLKSRS